MTQQKYRRISSIKLIDPARGESFVYIRCSLCLEVVDSSERGLIRFATVIGKGDEYRHIGLVHCEDCLSTLSQADEESVDWYWSSCFTSDITTLKDLSSIRHSNFSSISDLDWDTLVNNFVFFGNTPEI